MVSRPETYPELHRSTSSASSSDNWVVPPLQSSIRRCCFHRTIITIKCRPHHSQAARRSSSRSRLGIFSQWVARSAGVGAAASPSGPEMAEAFQAAALAPANRNPSSWSSRSDAHRPPPHQKAEQAHSRLPPEGPPAGALSSLMITGSLITGPLITLASRGNPQSLA